MTIEIHQPELEALIQQRMSSGHYRSVEDVLLEALSSKKEQLVSTPEPRTLDEVFAMVRGLADDVDFSRDRSLARDIDLS